MLSWQGWSWFSGRGDCMRTTCCACWGTLIWLCSNADLLQLSIYPVIALCREETRACNNSLQLTLERQVPVFPHSLSKRPYLAYPDLSSILLCNAWGIMLCDERHIQPIREDGEEFALESSNCGDWCAPSSTAVSLPHRYRGPEDTQDAQLHLAVAKETEYYVLHTRHGIPGLQQGKVRQLWVSHFSHQALLSCLSPPLLAQVQSCEAFFIPVYLLCPWEIHKIRGLPPGPVGESSFPWMFLLLKYHRTTETWRETDLQPFTMEAGPTHK